ncbi:probable multidrug resistance-associated protein lethal(2)03659 isoform X1 [Nasonia vitripennis]|uniref:Multidrug resistance-associated protein lethal(2)03659 n=1 Tax=Nasonia vitripennis TaxID=7425 RepID=A0A7M7TD39_NASVI|nr:probable multidrug resistance-associated protein lethal(2)03659 isoform X1 [Nasonia vitripennis]XP_032454759.1 probable multidrug resistance-associated protein lethal(2)03659 isoform X1 [Nasonia vitripennis]
MDGKVHAQRPKNPREGANPLSTLTFGYILRLFWVGYRRDLDIQDLYEPLKEHTSNRLGEKIARLWEQECQRVKKKQETKAKNGKNDKKLEPSLLRVLLRCFGFKLMLYGVLLAFMEIVLRLLQPIFLSLLIGYFRVPSSYVPINATRGHTYLNESQKSSGAGDIDEPRSVSQPLLLARLLKYFKSDSETTAEEAYLYAGGVVLCSALNVLVIHPYMMAILHMGMKMRVACCTLIYRKSLKLSRTALGETTVGQAVNLLSNDVNRFDVATIFLHYLWIGPLETIIVMYVMFNEVQESAIIGVATLLMFIPLQGFLGKKSSSLRLKTAIRTDERVRLTNEIISGIQAIKMYTWERPFSALIAKARYNEIKVIRGMSYIRGAIMSFIIFSTRLSLFITILAYVLFGNHINAEIVFMLTAYYNILRTNMTVFFPQGITQVAEVMVSIRRLQRFMLYEEVSTRADRSLIYRKPRSDDAAKKAKKDKKDKANGKTIEEFTPVDDPDADDGSVKLEHASAKWLDFVKEDTLHDINLEVKPGELIAVVGQVGSGKSSLLNVILKELPLTSGTVQVNGQIAYASQEPWLFAGSVRQNILFGRKMDQHKYEHVVKVCQLKRDFRLLPYGDKTIVGERGISLSGGQRARINLARAVYSDAPIYAFDDPLSAVDAHVGKHMFDECIAKYLKNKTRILVTHQLQYLRTVDRIIVLKDGEIKAEGSFDSLVARGVDFGRLLESQTDKPHADDTGSLPPSRGTSRQGSITSLSSFMTNENNLSFDDPKEEDEMRSSGNVGGWVYKGYFSAGGNCCIIVTIFVLFILAQFFASAGDFFISEWVKMEEKSPWVEGPNGTIVPDWKGPISRDNCIYIYSGITILTIVVTLVRSSAFFDMCMRASRNLHDAMFTSISHATMRFFNTNTSGRILNRFSKDMGAVDELLPIALIDCLQIGLTLVGIIVVVAISNPWLLIPTVLISIVFYYLRVIYIATGRSVKRLEGVTRSPVFGHLSASLQGLATIRAFDADETLINEFDQHQDLHSSAWFIFIATSRAFGFYLDVFCLLYIAVVTMSFFILGDEKADGGSVGLAITQSIGLTGMFQWGMRQSAELENQMTSVERMLEYSNLPSEPPLESIPEKKPKPDWPSEGKIEFKSVFLRYSPLDPPVLKNLNFVIQPKEKIGIVGRTGAGKSSLIQSLFRLADVQGRIEIDEIETSEIGLHDLRGKISIIPQEPFLFSGTLRKNLDPFDSYEDSVLWQALEEVELKEMGLTAHINEGGSNMSVGQRQLVCLARAIVKNNPILVLDEATANVDPRTDELIQKTIRTKFEKCTVLTIAHRLNTVMDSDRILVMDAGTAVEFEHPYILLQKESGYLRSMVNETGKNMAEALMTVAENAYNSTSNTAL